MKRKLGISLTIGIIMSAATLFMAFRNVPMADLVAVLGTFDWVWIVPTVVLVLVTFALRTYRWRLILKSATTLKYWQAFHPLMIGFMMNCILPGRMGELARPLLLKKERGIPISTGVATVAAERVLDLIFLISLFALFFGTITQHPGLDQTYFGLHLNSHTLTLAAWGMIRLSIALLVIIGLLIFKKPRQLIKTLVMASARWIVFNRPAATKHTERLAGFAVKLIDNFAIGMSMVRNPVRLAACVGLTILIWALTVLTYVVFAKGFPDLRLSYVEWTTVMVIICFFIALPSVPGYWGLWEAAGVFALGLFAITEKEALGYTLVNHATQVFPVIIVGLFSALLTSVNIWRLSVHSEPGDTPKTPR